MATILYNVVNPGSYRGERAAGSAVVGLVDSVTGEDRSIDFFDGSITDESDDTVVVRRTARLRGEVSASHVQVEDGTNLEDTVLSGRISLAET